MTNEPNNPSAPARIVLAMGEHGIRIWSGDELPASFDGEPQFTYWRADPGRFSDYRSDDLAMQCRLQADEALDPEYSQFMNAVADRLARTKAPHHDG